MRYFKVGFDIDDVFLHTYPALHEVCKREGITGECAEPTTWSPFEEYGCDRQVWVDALNKAAREGYLYRDIPPDEDALRAVRELYWAGHEIHLITARGFLGEADIIAEHTEGWLTEYAVPHHSLSYSQSKGHEVRKLGLDFFIDDNIRNWMDVLGVIGVGSYLLDRPWNQNLIGDTLAQQRAYSVQQYVDIIKEAANRE